MKRINNNCIIIESKLCDVFTRNWYRVNNSYPDGIEPHAGKKTYLARGVSQETAIKLCAEYNNINDGGKLSKKAEFQSI